MENLGHGWTRSLGSWHVGASAADVTGSALTPGPEDLEEHEGPEGCSLDNIWWMPALLPPDLLLLQFEQRTQELWNNWGCSYPCTPQDTVTRWKARNYASFAAYYLVRHLQRETKTHLFHVHTADELILGVLTVSFYVDANINIEIDRRENRRRGKNLCRTRSKHMKYHATAGYSRSKSRSRSGGSLHGSNGPCKDLHKGNISKQRHEQLTNWARSLYASASSIGK
jgi:hypothetical protein